MVEGEKDIQVRTISGDATTIRVSAKSTIEDLKLLLKRSFPPATHSPNFHLFFKGVKLKLEGYVDVQNIGNGEFIVLVPFTKKNSNQTQKSDQSNTPLNVPKDKSILKLADLAWSDMMQDLSCLSHTSCSGASSDSNIAGVASSSSFDSKRKRGIYSDDVILDILRCSKSTTHLDEQNCERFGKVLELVNCLRDPHSGSCMLSRISNRMALQANSGSSCFCPEWLTVILKTFTFLNIISTFIQLQQERTTLELLEKAVAQLGCFGIKLVTKDLEHLSVLCPKRIKVCHMLPDGFSGNEVHFVVLNNVCFYNCKKWNLRKVTSSYVCPYCNDLLGGGTAKRGLRIQEEAFLPCESCSISFGFLSIVFFSENVNEQNTSVDSLVIISCSTKENCQVKNCEYVPRRMAILDAFCALKRRENTFKMSLWESIEQFALVTEKKKFAFFSLEDMLLLAKDMSTVASGNQVKEVRRCHGTSSSHSNPKQCQVTDILSPLDMIEHLRNGTGSSGQIVHVEDIGVRKAIHVEILNILSKNIICALKRIGVTKLYSHQAESTRASLDGKHVVVATMTSSGKSLCYNLPTLEVLSQNMMSCALYLFPTKALAQDQLRALLLMTKQFDVSLNVGVYDGDTSQGDRAWLRDNARLLITNPDMLHLSILPYHKQFARILTNLRFVVVDESHVYKGVFGCHTALILRRLRRLCSYMYGSEPSFIFSTATSANPREHCMELANLPQVELIQNDGSPSARKLFILWNPLSHQETVLRRTHGHTDDSKSGHDDYKTKSSSPILHVSLLFAEMVQHGLRCIAFCKTRKLCELVLCYTREILQETAPHLVDSICAYRAGYMAEDRRSIERDFFGGKLCGVAATNALELGVDVGHIDVTLHLGFPGSIASLWQQAGRAGRRIKPSLAVYVAFEGPLDQYFMKYPRKLFDSPIEYCHIDSQNQQVLEQHLVCAALEHPLNLIEDEKYFGRGLEGSVMALKGRGYLSSDPSSDFNAKVWNYIGHEKVPSRSVSIRAIETEKYQVMDKRSNEVLEEIEESKAFFQVYEGAVYMRQGKTYLVRSLDLSSKIALCEEADLKYYTKSRDCTDIHVMGGDMLRGTMVRSDPCKVTTSWFGFHRLWKGSSKIFETVDHSLPKYSYMSQAVWVPVPQSTKAAVKMKNLDFRAGLHAASHAVLNVVPLRVICNLSDLAPECANPHDTRYFPERILLYDQHPGGVGLSLQVRSFFMGLLTAALELLTSCNCLGDCGCPNCVQSFACKEYNEVLHKDAAIMILKGVLDAEEPYR